MGRHWPDWFNGWLNSMRTARLVPRGAILCPMDALPGFQPGAAGGWAAGSADITEHLLVATRSWPPGVGSLLPGVQPLA